jgi:hypothetical protein
MFSELIYTRCRQGVDILKAGKAITSDGFKVYSSTPAFMESDNFDLQFLFNSAQGKQPYHDPDFMDNAYLYLVPDKGGSFMLEFYPIPFDANATGDYSHRSGNFLNHILACNFCEFYPFELFRDNDVWNAKLRGEAYYYENTPDTLPAHSEVNDPAGQIGIDEIASFISDGRAEALKKAVSFLITQYELPPENRKFLVIHDTSSGNIELWIAAIEYAFSRRIAAAIPFATRLEKFATANRYTVDQSGMYQTQINLQDPNQKQRYRAMIVGIDDRDKTNVTAARPLANSPFVLLDGKEKRAMFEADISNRYFKFITSFNDAHNAFCREFLQMIDIKKPCSDIFRLYDVYEVLENNTNLVNAQNVANALSVLDKYKVLVPSRLKNLYKRINDGLSHFLQENTHDALQIIKWLQSVSLVVGDNNATQRFGGIVCKAFTEQVYNKSDAEGAINFWKSIKDSEFSTDVARYFIEPSTIKSYNSDIQRFNKTDKITFVLIYLECAAFLGTVNIQVLTSIVKSGLQLCARENDIDNARKILNKLSLNKQANIRDILLLIVRETDAKYSDFFVKLLIESDKTIDTDNSSMSVFIKKLSAEKLEQLIPSVLKHRINNLSKAVDIEQFIKALSEIRSIGSDDLVKVYSILDGKLVLSFEKSSMSAASVMQEKKPKNAVCINSAHLYAIELLNDKQNRAQIINTYNNLRKQGFPSEKNKVYVQEFIDKLIKAQLNRDELTYFIKLFSGIPEYITELVSFILEVTTPKRNDEWNILMEVVIETNDSAVCNVIISDCAKLKKGEKALEQLSELLVKDEARIYFVQVKEKALEIINSNKSQSFFGRLFNK